jgi:methyltransferase-like protein/SAM-dependent methyltransferase
MTSYDEVPYPSFSYPQTHPDRLATLARLFGMEPAPVEHCRLLELGCASGGNLVPMAVTLPRSEFVGIDLSARQIADGQEAVARLGLKNVALGHVDLTEVPTPFGPFDYIIAHGIYSWVPSPVQDKILSICRSSLAPQGVAYVSYNTLPGWHGRGTVRDLMRYHTRQTADPHERVRQARNVLTLLAGCPLRPGYLQLLKEEQERLGDRPDPFLLHDQLADVNDPVYFHEFIERVGQQQLQYLAEAEISTMTARRLGPDVAAALERLGGDLLGSEQYLDFVTNRPFRQTLLCRADIALRREVRGELVAGFKVCSAARCNSSVPDLRPGIPEEFRAPAGNALGTDHALSKAALVHLEEAWPCCLTFADLEAAARARLGGGRAVAHPAETYAHDRSELADTLWQAFTADVVELHTWEPPLVLEPGARPRASPWARLQSEASNQVTNLRHEVVPVDDLTRHLLGLLDGTREPGALTAQVLQHVQKEGLVVQKHGRPVTEPDQLRTVLEEEVTVKLRGLGRSALLIG